MASPLDGRELEWTPGVGDGQGGLACCNSLGRKELDTTERLNWTELIHMKTLLDIIHNYSGPKPRIVSDPSFPDTYVQWSISSFSFTFKMQHRSTHCFLAQGISFESCGIFCWPHGLSSCGAQALPHSMWDLPRPGTEPALQGRFLTTGPPGKSLIHFFCLQLLSLRHHYLSSVMLMVI